MIVIAVVAAAVLSGSGAAAADRDYLTRLAAPARDSASLGAVLSDLLQHPRSQTAVVSSLTQLVRRQESDLAEATAISPPPTLRSEHQQALDALHLRLSGLQGLLEGVQGKATAAELALFADRLVASDVFWSDVFGGATRAQLRRDGAAGLTVPPSQFVHGASPADPTVIAALLTRTQPTPAAGNAVLKLGMSGPEVKAWQQALARWLATQPGHPKLAITGTFDQATQNATLSLQRAASITADGVVGPMTRAALRKLSP